MLTALIVLGLVVGLVLMGVALIFVVKRVGSGGEITVGFTLPLGLGEFKVEKASVAAVIFLAGALFLSSSGYLGYRTYGPEGRITSVDLGEVTHIEDNPSVDSVQAAFSSEGEEPPPMDSEAFIGAWLSQWYEQAQVNVDMGSDQGVEVGDYFATIQDQDEVESLPKEDVANLKDNGTALVRVVEVNRESSICQLDSWAFGETLEDVPEDATNEELFEAAAPVKIGEAVLPTPKLETRAWRDIEDQIVEAEEAGTSREDKRSIYEDVMDEADEFLLDHGDGFFAADVMWDKGYVQFKLADYDEAAETFDQFLDRFPFHPSAPGAREYRDEAHRKSA